MKITKKIIEQAEIAQKLITSSMVQIFYTIRDLSDKNESGILQTYMRGLAIDLFGKALTFPGTNTQEEADYLSKWILQRHGVNLTIKVNDVHNQTN